ncbi:phenoloxidase 2-like [Ischnura elegans]|uniref:phenoloxidase 2-like n=1 Tax=Ischnura elegans TaxID=197161 RepID=UPI001ED8AB74|nr:phenoloxidase 2-like [Ischnura elegans]
MVSDKTHILYLLCRPTEPIFIPKGRYRVTFDVDHKDFLAPQHQDVRKKVMERIESEVEQVSVPLKKIEWPDLSEVMEVGRHQPFSIFLPSHRRAAERLLDIFMGAASYEDFLSCAAYARDRVNPTLFVYTLSVAVIHRSDTKGIDLPPLTNIFPDKFIDGDQLARAKEIADVLAVTEGPRRFPVLIPRDYTSNGLDDEHRLAYFREDIGVNLHHWHWHLIYPFAGKMEIVNKDRRGELFYYMHQQIIARYNCERFCNHLGRVVRLLELRKEISEGYFPKLYCSIASKTWASRSANSKISDVRREEMGFVFDIEDLERWKTRIVEAIHWKRVIDKDGSSVALTENEGIDILGNLIEASPLLSKNYDIYGDLHNFGHVTISLCHDPDGRYKEGMGVMGETSTAMRDPVFYRWHAYIDYIFQLHKDTLKPYTLEELKYEGIHVEEIRVQTDAPVRENILKTFMETTTTDLQGGLDFIGYTPLKAQTIRLQHVPFSYTIKVGNNLNKICKGTMRIFLSPKFDEKGEKMLFLDQKRLFIELDKFSVTLTNDPLGNKISRQSRDSNVTRKLGRNFSLLECSLAWPCSENEEDAFCGCGWPQNMLIPKGTPEGSPYQLFVMVSDAEIDLVQPRDRPWDRSSYCGVRDSKYPDSRAMGYPFDRPPSSEVKYLEDFVRLAPNMAVQDVTIIFEDGPPKSHKLDD